MWKAFTETQKYDFEAILLNFGCSQFTKQVPMEHFMSEKVVNEAFKEVIIISQPSR